MTYKTRILSRFGELYSEIIIIAVNECINILEIHIKLKIALFLCSPKIITSNMTKTVSKQKINFDTAVEYPVTKEN